MTNSNVRLPAWIFSLVIASVFLGIGNRGLLTPDEPREAAILLDMAQRQDFVVPHLLHEPFVEKPPLYYAVGAALHGVLGSFLGIEALVQLTSVLFGVLALVSVAILARRWLAPERARLAVVLYAISTAFLEHAHYVRTDIALAATVVAAIAAFSEAYEGGRVRALPIGGAFTALALLAKGLIGPALIFPAWLALFVRAARHPDARVKLSSSVLWHGVALVAFLALGAPWVQALYARDPELFRTWFLDNHFKRAAGTAGLGHDDGGWEPWYYLFTALGDTLPWTPLLVCWPIVAWRAKRQGATRPLDFLLLAWMGGVLLLLTASSTKRNVYLLPLLPAFALAGASAWPQQISPRLAALMRGTAILALLVSCAIAIAPWLIEPLSRPAPRWRVFFPGAGSAAHVAAFVLALFAALLVARRKRLEAPVVALAAALIANALVLGTTLPAKAAYLDPRAEIARMDAALCSRPQLRYASYGLGEIQRGWLFLYGFADLQPLSLERARQVLAGRDAEYAALLVGRRSSREELASPLAPLLEVTLDPESKGNSALYLFAAPTAP
jgi:4-amino-4-deoxy-L-arabinose transferase-like glycosyltransferase